MLYDALVQPVLRPSLCLLRVILLLQIRIRGIGILIGFVEMMDSKGNIMKVGAGRCYHCYIQLSKGHIMKQYHAFNDFNNN